MYKLHYHIKPVGIYLQDKINIAFRQFYLCTLQYLHVRICSGEKIRKHDKYLYLQMENILGSLKHVLFNYFYCIQIDKIIPIM